MKTFTLLAFLILSAYGGFAQAPTINAFPVGSASVAPYSGATGTTMTITGTNFTGTLAVSFGGTPASSFTVVSSTTITAVVAGGSTGIVSVTTAAGTATRSGFTYLPLSRIVTDFGGYWSSTSAAANSTVPDSSHNLLGYNYNNTFYSTGVNDALLTTKGITYTSGNYRAFPVSGIAGSNPASSSVFLAVASKADGNAATGNLAGVASATVRSVLIDGTRGLDLGTGVTNLPTSAVMTFNLNSINVMAVADAEPDILITQIADPSAGNDVFQFVDASGTLVGTPITQDMTVLTSFGNYKLDLFSFASGAPYNTATPTAVSSSNGTKGIRLVAFKLSDFGITALNVASVKALKIIPSGNSDYAFIAYNVNAISAAPNISQNSATTTSNVCTTGTAVLSVIGTASSGGTLTYFWERSTNGGTSWSTVTEGGNFSGSATNRLNIINPVNNDKYRATVSESGGGNTNTSAVFTLTVAVPTVAGSLSGSAAVCTGTNATTLTLSGQTGSVVQWESSSNNFGTTAVIANTTATLTATNLSATTQYRAVVQSGACASGNSTLATVTVSPASVGGSIAGSTAVCSGTNSTTLTLSGQTGNIVRWESSINNFVTTANIANTTSSLPATNLSATTQYRAVVQSGTCVTDNSSTALITYNAVGQWIGGTTGNWNIASNWCGGVPTATTNVQIPSAATVTISYGNALGNTVTIASGGGLVITDTANLFISASGAFSNGGAFDASASTTGKVSFSGNGTISGTSTFGNIETFGALDFGTASTVSKNLTIQAGGSVVSNSPTYLCPSATLIYNTGGTFARGFEWPSVSSGKGFPSNVLVKNATTINFPVAGAGYICNDLTIENGSSLSQNYSGSSASLNVGNNVNISGVLSLGANAGGDIALGGSWTRNTGGVFNNNGRSVTFNNSASAVITAPASATRDANGAFGGETFYNLNINKTVSTNTVLLGSNISVTSELNLTKGILDLVNSDVTIVSTATNTAHIGQVPASGVEIRYGGPAGTGSGKFIVQRHLAIGLGSVSRRWRLLAVPLQSTGAPTLNAAWQSGISNSNRSTPLDPWPGFGTTITKSTVYNSADGYDVGSTNNPSMYYFNGGVWSVLPSTKVPITDHEAYMLFARGNRSIVVSSPDINANSTVLEPKGRINIGDIQKTVAAGLNAIGNPYASSISFNNLGFKNFTSGGIAFTNVTPASVDGIGLTYYLWDPKTGGNAGVGKWITCSSNGDGTYAITRNASGLPTDGTIQSGAAFMVNADLTGGTITFHETDKLSSSSSIGIASRGSRSTEKIASLATTLLIGTGADAIISEGIINTYYTAYHNEVDGQDAPANNSFSISNALRIRSGGKYLAIERRKEVAQNDTIFLQILNVSKKAYDFQFQPANMSRDITAFLEDAFLGTSSPISITDSTLVSFTITDDEKSSSPDRFRIVFKRAMVLPVTHGSIKAFQQSGNIAVQWTLGNEFYFKKSFVEKSVNGFDFSAANMIQVDEGNRRDSVYNWFDRGSMTRDNFYRIKNIGSNDTVSYSKIVKIIVDAKPGVEVYPNPVTDGMIGLQLKNMPAGDYQIDITNNLGQLMNHVILHHLGGNASQTIRPVNRLASGNYTLKISGRDKKSSQSIKILVQAGD